MKLNKGLSLEQIADYLALPDSRRPFASYREELLEPEPAFDREEVERLIQIVAMDEPRHSRFGLSKLLIDLSWASSHLEGNTYSQLDTQALIEYGQANEDKPAEDAVMILNHKKAIEYMLSKPLLAKEQILIIHRLLADNSMAPGSRHFLGPDRCGLVRSYRAAGLHIDGSSYLPPQVEDRAPDYIEQEFERLIASANALPDAINRSFFLMTRIPYLQVFYDANKSTSRISCNIPLIQAGLSPMSFVDFDKRRYLEGLIAFYELGDERLARNAWLTAYLASAFRYLPFGEEARFALSVQRDEHLATAVRYVVEAVREGEPLWLRRGFKKA